MYKYFFKRFFDFWIALIALLCLSPILLVITIWLHFANRGAGAFFFQERPGKDGKIFRVVKFKTMTDERGADGELLPDEDRLTRVGSFVRSTSIDELPQLWNVLIGDMSLVGPRPEVERYVRLYTPEQRVVLSVRPGITDYASIAYSKENEILGTADDPERMYIEEIMPEKIKYNLQYINNRSLGEYFKIIFMTFFKILKH